MNDKIRRAMRLSLVVSLLFTFVGCRKNPASDDSALSAEIEYVYLNTPSEEEKTESNDESSSNNSEVAQSNNSNNSSNAPGSTVTTPKQAFLYKDGKKYSLKDAELNLRIAKRVESWFAGNGAIAAASLAVNEELIWEIKSCETAIEFFYDDEILLNGKKGVFGSSRGFLIPITGDYNKNIFKCDSDRVYYSGPLYSPQNSSINEIIKSINLEASDELENKSPWSDITAPEHYFLFKDPEQAFLYKDGKKYRLTDKEQMLKIARTLAKRFDGKWKNYDDISYSVSETIDRIKSNDNAIEFCYADKEISTNGEREFYEGVKGVLIPISGGMEGCIFPYGADGVYFDDFISSKYPPSIATKTLETELVEN